MKASKVSDAILGLFLFICIFFPADKYNVKAVALVLLIILEYAVIGKKITHKKYLKVLVIGLLYPLGLLAFSIMRSGKVMESISGAHTPLIFLLLIPVYERHLDYEKFFFNFLRALAWITIGLVVLDIIGIANVNDSPIRTFVYNMEIGLMGKSPDFAAYYKVFLKASPLLLFLLDDGCKKRNYTDVIISLIALVLSGTRANIIIAAGYLGFRFAFPKNNKNEKWFIRYARHLTILLVIPVAYLVIRKMMSSVGSLYSDAIRFSQIRGHLEEMRDPITLLIGQGFGSDFYDYGRMVYSSASELAYFNLLRQVGLIFFVPFMFFIFYPLFVKIDRYTRVVYAGYLIGAFFNPLLFSSTAFVAYIYIYLLVIRYKQSVKVRQYFSEHNLSMRRLLRQKSRRAA